MKPAWRVFRVSDDGKPQTLFHGLNGSRTLELDKVLIAENKIVTNPGGGREFLSGWHVVETYDEIMDYLKRFKHPKELAICQVQVDDFRPKAGSVVLLADQMLIETDEWMDAWSRWVKIQMWNTSPWEKRV